MIPEALHPPNYLAGLRKDALKGKRLGYPANLNGTWLWPGAPGGYLPIAHEMEKTVKVLESLGATVVRGFDLPELDRIRVSPIGDWALARAADFKIDLADYLGKAKCAAAGDTMLRLITCRYIPSGVKTLADVIAFNIRHADLEFPPSYEDQELYALR
jgi:amidase